MINLKKFVTESLQINLNICLLKMSYLSYFLRKNYFEGDDGTQNTLVFQVKDKYFKREVNIGNGNSVYKSDIWKSKGLSTQNLVYSGSGTVIRKLMKATYVALNKKDEYFQQKDFDIITSRSIVNIYIVYNLSFKTISSGDALKNCLFGTTDVKKPNKLQILISGNIAVMVLRLIARVNLHALMLDGVEM